MGEKLKKEDIFPVEIIQKTLNHVSALAQHHIDLQGTDFEEHVPTILDCFREAIFNAKRENGRFDKSKLGVPVDQTVRKLGS